MSVGNKIAHDRGRHEPRPRKRRRHDTATGPNRRRSAPDTARTHPTVAVETQGAPTGYVDGAWWPRSDDLTTELPDLLAVLAVRLGPIDRVLYKLNDWAKAPTKLASGGRAVRRDGYRLQPPNTVEVLGLNRNRIVLLVVPPHTDPDHAHATMMAAVGRSDDSTVGGLLMASEPDRETHTQTAAAVESPTAVVDILHNFIGTAAPNADLTSPKS